MSQPLFDRLREATLETWETYVDHAFVRQLARGTLPEAYFRHYLVQDYLFLFHFARAYALSAAKAETLDDIKRAAGGLSALIDVEMGLHVRYCAQWGIDPATLTATPEATDTLAYTRFVIDRGLAGDLLDLQVALAPCMAGYAEIGARLSADPETRLDGNPYRSWIEMYASPAFQQAAATDLRHLDDLWYRRGAEARFNTLAETFRTATRLEAAFWDMGLTLRR